MMMMMMMMAYIFDGLAYGTNFVAAYGLVFSMAAHDGSLWVHLRAVFRQTGKNV